MKDNDPTTVVRAGSFDARSAKRPENVMNEKTGVDVIKAIDDAVEMQSEPLDLTDMQLEALTKTRTAVAELMEAAQDYAFNYAQDEAEDDGPNITGCTQLQSDSARRLFRALAACRSPAKEST